jgi:hypothetical protein
VEQSTLASFVVLTFLPFLTWAHIHQHDIAGMGNDFGKVRELESFGLAGLSKVNTPAIAKR